MKRCVEELEWKVSWRVERIAKYFDGFDTWKELMSMVSLEGCL